MFTIAAAVLALLASSAVQNEEEARPRVVSSTPSRAITARAPSLPDGPTRRVCGYERAMDSNIQRRVCRQVPINNSGRERMAGDYLQQLQSIGLNAENGPNQRQPGGRSVN
ncbi:hypothetical protein D8I30_03410 [Brevundimonas naejangsanensis]|uniref:Secreted protein n=1 Tax=Brevundimonas naejangsanensis TaxID=588932 RepID=A0A494RDD0_9CAUL|nr:hypothetical protein [Brevundimonas naejangsanensis]AYG94338.1 hypothetical protein D8I30_03410 [Brevundimonas naejangsanensis]